jgi:hypothetical protein
MEFIISKKEIVRRKKAFVILLSSMMVGLFLSSLFLEYEISMYGYLFIFILFIFLIAITFNFFNSISKLKIFISEEEITKTNKEKSETFLLSEIKHIKVKRRTNGIIREIYITFNNQKELIITAFEENFENIKNLLIGKRDSIILLKETKELIDFDHPLFYSILGLPISFVSIIFIKLITNLEHFQTKYILFALSLYVFVIGAYFFIKKPMFITFGKKHTATDYVIGSIIVCGGIFLFLVGLSL